MIYPVPDKIRFLAVFQLRKLVMDQLADGAHKMFFFSDDPKKRGHQENNQAEYDEIKCNPSGHRRLPEETI